MTVLNQTSKAGPYTGNGTTTSFAFDFKVLAESDLIVTITLTSTGFEYVSVLNTDYSVSLNADQENNPGGTITYPISGDELESTHTITIERLVDYTQETDLVNQGAFYAQVIEDTLDKIVMMIQQLNETLSRTLRVGPSEDGELSIPTLVPSSFLGVNADGDGLVWAVPAETLIEISASAPDPAEYPLWYDSVNEVLKYWDGSQWTTTADISGKADKYGAATLGEIPTYDAFGNLAAGIDPAVVAFLNQGEDITADWEHSGALTIKELTETEYSLTGTVIDPANGTVQYKTLAANWTLVAGDVSNISDGQSVMLMIDDGAGHTINWSSLVTWVRGSAPTLGVTGWNVIFIWSTNGTLFGNHIGAAY